MAEATPIDYASPTSSTRRVSKAAFWAGWVITTIIILWMGVLGIVIMVASPGMMRESMTKYGYPESAGLPIFIAELACVLLYAIPRTAVLGAMLLTGYLGGAVATHVHASEWGPMFMPVVFGVLVWLGLLFREPRLRELAPLRRL